MPVIECVPVASVEVVNVATPLTKVPEPSVVVPSMKVTEPVGVGPPVDGGTGWMVAVKVTVCPRLAGFGDPVSVIVVLAWLTVCVTAFEVLPERFESPPYTAVTESLPTARVEIDKLAEPPLNTPVPNTVVPFMNEIPSPLGGAPIRELTVAVKLTACPYPDGFGEDASVVVVAARTSILVTNASFGPPP